MVASVTVRETSRSSEDRIHVDIATAATHTTQHCGSTYPTGGALK
jgi:hypothetical protein